MCYMWFPIHTHVGDASRIPLQLKDIQGELGTVAASAAFPSPPDRILILRFEKRIFERSQNNSYVIANQNKKMFKYENIVIKIFLALFSLFYFFFF